MMAKKKTWRTKVNKKNKINKEREREREREREKERGGFVMEIQIERKK